MDALQLATHIARQALDTTQRNDDLQKIAEVAIYLKRALTDAGFDPERAEGFALGAAGDTLGEVYAQVWRNELWKVRVEGD